MSAILRERINSLLTANADLEREVARLRYAEAGTLIFIAFFCIFTRKKTAKKISWKIRKIFAARGAAESVETLEKLRQTRDTLNNIVNENDQLKIQVLTFL